nr:serine-rich adhesin for platelets-like [Tanacetum cinerariifolium]
MAHADNNSLFIDTNLDTHFAIIVSHSDTISDLR